MTTSQMTSMVGKVMLMMCLPSKLQQDGFPDLAKGFQSLIDDNLDPSTLDSFAALLTHTARLNPHSITLQQATEILEIRLHRHPQFPDGFPKWQFAKLSNTNQPLHPDISHGG